MSDVPYPITAQDLEEMRKQVWDLIQDLYENKIGGASLGDVFAIVGDVLTLSLDGDSLQKTSTGLKVGQSSAISAPSGGGTQDAEARQAIEDILALLVERGLMA